MTNQWKSSPFLTAEQWSVQAERLWQVLDLSDPLVHGSGEVVGMIQAAQDDAGEVHGLSEVAHQRALESNHVPPEEGQNKRFCSISQITIQFVRKLTDKGPLVLFVNHREEKDTKTRTLLIRLILLQIQI